MSIYNPDSELRMFDNEMTAALIEYTTPLLEAFGGTMDRTIPLRRQPISARYREASLDHVRLSEDDVKAVYQQLRVEILHIITTAIVWSGDYEKQPRICPNVPFHHTEEFVNRAMDKIGDVKLLLVPVDIGHLFMRNSNRVDLPLSRRHESGITFGYSYQGIPLLIDAYASHVSVVGYNAFRYRYEKMLSSVKTVDAGSFMPVIGFSSDLTINPDPDHICSMQVEK